MDARNNPKAMDADTLTLIGIAVALAALMLRGQYRTDKMFDDVRRDIGELRGRMARLEGLFEGFTGRRPEN